MRCQKAEAVFTALHAHANATRVSGVIMVLWVGGRPPVYLYKNRRYETFVVYSPRILVWFGLVGSGWAGQIKLAPLDSELLARH